MTSPSSPTAPKSWDPHNMEATLLGGPIMAIMRRSNEEPPFPPLHEFVEASTFAASGGISPALSYASEDSLDSIMTGTSASNSIAEDLSAMSLSLDDDMETNQLIYRLCRSLYRKALQKTEGNIKNRSKKVSVNTRNEVNMSRVTDWMPLLHLFDPKSFYAYREGGLPGPGVSAFEVPTGLLRSENPREASRRLLDEMEVAKLSGGNSNHVYRLGHPHFPEKTILLRVYGGGDDDAIDRYRDVAAMKLMSRAKLAPAVLHTFKWGRVEEFMENVATGSTDMLISSPRLLADVFEVLYEMHQLPAAPFYPQAANQSRFKRNAVLASALDEAYADPEDYLARNIARLERVLLSNARTSADPSAAYYTTETEVKLMEEICPTAFERASLRFLRLATPTIKEAYRRDFVRFITHEIMYVRGMLQRLSAPIVFAHNDLNPANILLSWRRVPKQFRAALSSRRNTALSFDREMDQMASDCDDDDEVTSVVSQRSSLISRKFLTRKGHHRNLVDLKGIIFIDFEYSDANYRAFDLGNTLYELDYDYSRGSEDDGPGFIKYLYTFPPVEFKDRWADKPIYYPRLPEVIYAAWMEEQNIGSRLRVPDWELGLGASCLRAISAYFKKCDPRAGGGAGAANMSTTLTREQLTEVLLGMLASQLHWSLWSFTLAGNTDTLTNQTIDDDTFAKGSSGLDYVRYGDCRLKEYLCLKAWMAENKLV